MDRDTVFNWIGDPWGSAAEWIADNLVPISRRGPSTTVPDLNGVFATQARILLRRADLRMKVIEPPGRGAGQIIVRQEPAAGARVQRRTKVTVYVELPGAAERPAYA